MLSFDGRTTQLSIRDGLTLLSPSDSLSFFRASPVVHLPLPGGSSLTTELLRNYDLAQKSLFKTKTQISQAAFKLIFCARADRTKMDPAEHEKFSFQLAKTLVSDASRCVANANTSLQEKSRAMELVLGFNWTKVDQGDRSCQNLRSGTKSYTP